MTGLLRCQSAGVMLAMALLLAATALPAAAQQVSTAPPPAQVEGPSWKELTRSQRAALRPLEREWPGIDAPRKRKWLEIAARFPSMNPQEKARLQERMTQWARLSPEERRIARMNYRDAKDVSPQDRRNSWEAYQALTEDERHRLARQAAGTPSSKRKKAQAESGSQAKSNIVPNPAFASPPKPVAPVILQAKPGATTTFISKRPAPPWHQQPGMPKIAATPEFVDANTLLPKVGPQAVPPLPAASTPRRK